MIQTLSLDFLYLITNKSIVIGQIWRFDCLEQLCKSLSAFNLKRFQVLCDIKVSRDGSTQNTEHVKMKF